VVKVFHEFVESAFKVDVVFPKRVVGVDYQLLPRMLAH